MKFIIYFNFLLISCLLYTQQPNHYNIGFSLGSSDILRNNEDKTNPYNYENQELSMFVGSYCPWKNNKNRTWNKYWITQINVSTGDYYLLYMNKESKTFSSLLSSGIRLERKLFNSLNFESSLMLGAGYHTGLPDRLAEGFYFREAVVLGINKTWNHGFKNQLGIGFQHASNANLYSLNRGYESLFLRLGIIWP